jgi:nitroreductase/dihydropteridine reductase
MDTNMCFLNIAQSRYTTKRYDSTKKIDSNTLNKLKEIIRLSPSSINSQPWKFTFVENETIKNELSEFSHFNSDKIKDASHVVVFSVMKDAEAFENMRLTQLPEGTSAYYNRVLKPKGDEQIMNWLSSQVYISLGFFLSAAASLGIDSTPMEGIEKLGYDSVLQDDGYKTLFAVAIGYRHKEDINQILNTPKFRLEQDQVIRSI